MIFISNVGKDFLLNLVVSVLSIRGDIGQAFESNRVTEVHAISYEFVRIELVGLLFDDGVPVLVVRAVLDGLVYGHVETEPLPALCVYEFDAV